MRDWLKYHPLTAYAMGGDQTGGGGQQQQTPDPNADPAKQQQKQQDNKQDNNDNFDNLWQDDTEEDEEHKAKAKPNGQGDDVDHNKVFNDYLGSLNFMEGVDSKKITEDLNSGSTESLEAAMGKVAQNAYKRVMVDANKLIEQKITKAVDTAVSKARAGTEGDVAVRLMNSKLEFTKDKSISPVAKAVLARSMQKGQDVDEAINTVERYFRQLGEKAAKTFGRDKPPRNTPRGGYVPAPSMDGDEEIEDWEEFLQHV